MRRVPFFLGLAMASTVAAHAFAGPYGLPWPPTVTGVSLSQDCNDACCNDHVGAEQFAWDFSAPATFQVAAARAGTVTHLKIASTTGCANASCIGDTNYTVVDHGDGTQAVYLHLKGDVVGTGAHCGDFVRRGQVIGIADTTGFASGPMLTFQVNPVLDTMTGVCECGPVGVTCDPATVAFGDFLATASAPTQSLDFDEFQASACANRRITMPASTNADAKEPVVVIDDGDGTHFRFTTGVGVSTSGGYAGNYRVAPASTSGTITVAGTFEVSGLIKKPGVYEVRSFVPFGATGLAKNVRHLAVGRGMQAFGVVDQSVVGGAFHPVVGLEAVKFTGAPGESVVVTNDTTDGGSMVAFDAIVLHLVAPPGAAAAGDPCSDSTQCSGTLLCAAGRCVAGCDETPCPCGTACDPTGVCVAGDPTGCGAGGGFGSAVGTGDSSLYASASTGYYAGYEPSGCTCRIGDDAPVDGRTWLVAAGALFALHRRRRRA